jgi:hypothetical protein
VLVHITSRYSKYPAGNLLFIPFAPNKR